ncbi:MAG: amino acid permease, partial [Curtobacterium sp.]
CYAEFASTIPVAGSAYTFTYATIGELLAWIVGWDLILETLTASAVIAKYWGIYLSTAFDVFGVKLPDSIALGPIGFAWGPVLIVAVFTVLLAFGTRLSSRVSAVITIVKVAIVVFVIVAGAFFVKAANFTPFVPPAAPSKGADGSFWTQSLVSWATGSAPAQYGVFGLLAAASLVFFAFIGFDVVATSAEETENPQKTLPRGIFLGLGIVTVLYVAVSVVITGMVSYQRLAQEDSPSLASAFSIVGLPWAAGIIAIGSLVGLTTVVMVLLLGLSRIVFSMSRDGLLPRWFSQTNPRTQTPVRVQVVAGVVVAVLAGFFPVEKLEGMINIGTLSAFVLVSIGIVVLRRSRPDAPRAFRVPWSPVLPILSAVLCFWLMLNLEVETWLRFVIWLAIGFAIYFGYSRRHSRVGQRLQ